MLRTFFRWPYIVLIVAVAAAMSYVSGLRLGIETDITKSLPTDDPVIRDAEYVMLRHPIKDRIAIDLGSDRPDPDLLVAGAAFIEERLAASGLFKTVGLGEYQTIFPELITHILQNLPTLFSARELVEQIFPLLDSGAIRKILTDSYAKLGDLEGIGQAGMMAADPLGLKNLVLARLSHLAPSSTARIYQGHLLTSDDTHILVTAEPNGSGTDTALARKISAVMRQCADELEREFKPRGRRLVMTPVGAYRDALDNEEAAKKDTQKAVFFATIGIALLLVAGFPRPWLGLLALAPAILGMIAAAFVYSIFTRSISILAIGFGGAIISFTVDYGIAYLLFLDRPQETRGMEVTKEVWGLGLLAMLTTAVSFACLFLSGFPALAQIGYFTGLGVCFTYIFVHTLFPVIFPVMAPAKRRGFIPLQKFVNRLLSGHSLYRAVAALIFCGLMIGFARPNFKVDLAAMNSVSRDTLRAEDRMIKTWGNVLSSIYLMTEAGSLDELRRKGDLLADALDAERASGTLAAAFTPSMLFPGQHRMEENLRAWERFWTAERVAGMEESVRKISREIGFASGAFDSFFTMVKRRDFRPADIAPQYYSILGIRRAADAGQWALFSVISSGPAYQADSFFQRISASGLARLFDPAFFGERLGAAILAGFLKMAVIIAAITALVAIVYLRDLKLTLISLAPTLFSLICTLGTLRLMGRPPGISAIIVAVIVIGMGTDYALYLVRAYQRYLDPSHPSLALIQLTVFLSACSTLIGFGVLALAEHALLRTAGLTLLLGIGYSFAGTVLIVPPLLHRVFKGRIIDPRRL
ncbi:MAG: MMPL family transporter [Desulfobacteraceae bacterium]|nr:MMPL family transporter [Desulfobacteraceae bacterium]